jgi:hypothetical protein
LQIEKLRDRVVEFAKLQKMARGGKIRVGRVFGRIRRSVTGWPGNLRRPDD